MKVGMVAVFVALGISAAKSEEELVFSGSFWDRGDSFILRFVLSEQPAKVEWDGHGENLQERKDPDKERIRLVFSLSEEEEGTLRELVRRFSWCRTKSMVLGTGLSISSHHQAEGKMLFSRGFFGVREMERLGRRGEALPLLFQQLVSDGEFSAEDRASFFVEVRSLVGDLADYDRAYAAMELGRKEKSSVSWKQISKWVVKPYPEPGLPEIADQLSRHEAEAALVIDAMLKENVREPYFDSPAQSAMMVSVGAISIQHPRFGGNEVLPRAIESPTPARWEFLNPAFWNFLEDYAIGPDEHSAFILEEDLTLVGLGTKPLPDQLARTEFLRSSDFRSFVVPEAEVDDSAIGHLRIHRITFERNMTRCSIVTNRNHESSVTLLELEDAGWKVLRHVTHADWEEYGWKKPLFQ
ncbi:MAG: hypothetical protein JNJ70_01195 [Verrucomicrobiales bacterium]|nr:hypothetical protein [Verrucomicrobiales bacterium]